MLETVARAGGELEEPQSAHYVTQSFGQVAQLVEQRTENPRVGGSIPSLAILSL